MKHIQTYESFINESVNEGFMSELDIIRQESKTLQEFIKKSISEYPPLKGEEKFLEDMWNASAELDESKDENKPYFKGISKSTAAKKKAQMHKQADMDDDDPEAYKELPGDTKGKKLLKTSKHTQKYHELYGDKKK